MRLAAQHMLPFGWANNPGPPSSEAATTHIIPIHGDAIMETKSGAPQGPWLLALRNLRHPQTPSTPKRQPGQTVTQYLSWLNSLSGPTLGSAPTTPTTERSVVLQDGGRALNSSPPSLLPNGIAQ